MALPWDQDYQYNELFENHNAMRSYLSFQIVPERDLEGKPLKPPADAPYFIQCTFAYPVLKRDAEKSLFIKMNYAKHLAVKAKGRHNDVDWKRNLSIADDTRTILVHHNLRLVVHLAKQFKSSKSIEDLVSEGNFSLMKAVDKFNPFQRNLTGSTNKFSTYASNAIIRNFIRDNIPKKNVPLTDTDIGEYPVLDPESIEEVDRTSLLVQKIMRLLDFAEWRERETLLLSVGYLRPLESLDEIGSRYGLTKERMRQIRNGVAKRIRTALSHDDAGGTPMLREPKKKAKGKPEAA